GSKNLTHATLAELAFDTVWSQTGAGRESGGNRVIEEMRIPYCCIYTIKKFAAGRLYQKRFHFAAQFGICLRQQRRTFIGSALESQFVELFDLSETVPSHGQCPDGFGIVCLNSRRSQALAKCHSRRAVRGEILRATTSSSLNPPK